MGDLPGVQHIPIGSLTGRLSELRVQRSGPCDHLSLWWPRPFCNAESDAGRLQARVRDRQGGGSWAQAGLPVEYA